MSTYPNIKQAIWLMVLFLLYQIAFMIPVAIIGKVIDVSLETSSFVLGIVTLIAIGLILRRVLRKTDASFDDLFPLVPIPAVLLLPMILTLLGLGTVISEIENVVRYFVPIPKAFAETFNNLAGTESVLWSSLFFVAFVAPLSEEFLFRGVILYGFLKNYSVRMAIIWSALLFGIIHCNPWQFPVAFVLGLVFAWWVIRAGSVWPALLGHVLHNARSVIVAHFTFADGTKAMMGEVVFQPWWMNTLGVLQAIAGLWWFYKLTLNTGYRSIPGVVTFPDETMERAGV